MNSYCKFYCMSLPLARSLLGEACCVLGTHQSNLIFPVNSLSRTKCPYIYQGRVTTAFIADLFIKPKEAWLRCIVANLP